MRELSVKHGKSDWDVVKLGKALEQGYLLQRRETKESNKTSFAPSSIGYAFNKCPRKWYYAFRDSLAVDSSDAQSIAAMSAGVSAHERIQSALELAGVLDSKEIELTLDDPPIRGFVDVIVNIDGQKIVGEIKTSMQEGFLWRQAKLKAADYHMYQILLYMYVLKIKDGFVLYENKSNNDIVIIPVQMTKENEAIVENALEWMRDVFSNVELPTRCFTKKSKECKQCPFAEQCWDDMLGEKIMKPMEVAIF